MKCFTKCFFAIKAVLHLMARFTIDPRRKFVALKKHIFDLENMLPSRNFDKFTFYQYGSLKFMNFSVVSLSFSNAL